MVHSLLTVPVPPVYTGNCPTHNVAHICDGAISFCFFLDNNLEHGGTGVTWECSTTFADSSTNVIAIVEILVLHLIKLIFSTLSVTV